MELKLNHMNKCDFFFCPERMFLDTSDHHLLVEFWPNVTCQTHKVKYAMKHVLNMKIYKLNFTLCIPTKSLWSFYEHPITFSHYRYSLYCAYGLN